MDNNTYIDQYYLGEPAFSVYIEDGAEKILFDTGYSDAFLRNAEQMRIDMNALTYIVLSHGHNDHSRGLTFLWDKYDLKNVKLVAGSFCAEEVHGCGCRRAFFKAGLY